MPDANHQNKLLCVAPMMAWTDRHCRYLHRLFAPSALLFTEMVTTGALLRGGQIHLLDHSHREHPVALQLGGNDPNELAACTSMASELGFDEVNLNVGCPSDKVKKGSFGACLMAQPSLVADCVQAMQEVTSVPVTVKCRLGIDDSGTEDFLNRFLDAISHAGCTRVYVHARIAILSGLSAAQNRSVPPLLPERATRVKEDFPHLQVVMNGGITSTAAALDHLSWADGIMVGRAAYQSPQFLTELETAVFGSQSSPLLEKLDAYREYMIGELANGARLHSMTRHVLTACSGLPGARRFRQLLSDHSRLKQEDIGLFDDAVQAVYPSLQKAS